MTRNQLPAIQALDMFSGVGGSSCGARSAGINVVAAIDTWDTACDTYRDNFPDTRIYQQRCEDINPRNLAREVGPIQLIIASPECTNHTCAKGAADRSEESRDTAFQVTRFARVLKPRWIVVENVVHMRSWHRYDEWLNELISLGYNIREQVLNASDFGVPQSRRRLFVICDRKCMPSEVVPPLLNTKPLAKQFINTNGVYKYTPLRTERRAKATIDRAERAIAAVGRKTPFLLVYYGTDGSGGWQKVDAPLRTITTLDRFAYVRPTRNGGHEMRMLQVPELREAMGFPDDYLLDRGTRRSKIMLMGNAVCPIVMTAVINSTVTES